jgi:putative endonuclease
MKYVYLLQSIPFPEKRYVGLSSNVEKRLNAHNQGRSSHTAKFKPWKLMAYVAFSSESRAVEFERYLKSGSGRAFADRRLWES